MKRLLFVVFILLPFFSISQTTDIRIPTSIGSADSLGGKPASFYMDTATTQGISGDKTFSGKIDMNDSVLIELFVLRGSFFDTTGLASTTNPFWTYDGSDWVIASFQDTVSANSDVTSNTTHRTSDGSDHTFVDQDITSGSSPVLNGENVKGLQGFFLEARGLSGLGAGFADEGFIGDVPVILFAGNATEKAIYSFYALNRIILTDTNPTLNFIVYSTTAPVVTTSDSVRWQLEARYIAETELATKVVDETMLLTQGLPTTVANSRQSVLQFTLDKTKIVDQDVLLFTLSRIGGDGSDIYGSDVAVGQSGIRVEARSNNP